MFALVRAVGRFWAVVCFVALSCGSLSARELSLYLDADFQDHENSARSIQVGLETAIAMHSGLLPEGVNLRVVPKDHRGNVKRSAVHFREYLSDPEAIAVVGGLHSPPYLEYRDYVNENNILLLLPWSAAGPITRGSFDGRNWIFRLSVDDTKAGGVLARHAIETRKCQAPALLLWESGWGRSNERTMSAAFETLGMPDIPRVFFSGNLNSDDAKLVAANVAATQADCVLFVGNAREGVEIISALAQMDETFQLISHWGITGGRFAEFVPEQTRDRVGLEILQTCFSYETDHPALQFAKDLFPEDFDTEGRILAPTGFFHGYDLATVFLTALATVDMSQDINALRSAVREALENPDLSAAGLMKSYSGPFSAYSDENPDAHEALGMGDLCLTSYDSQGRVRPPE